MKIEQIIFNNIVNEVIQNSPDDQRQYINLLITKYY